MNWSINNSTTARLLNCCLKIQKDLRAAQRRRKTESEYREKVKGECKMQFRHTHPVNHFTSVNTIVTLLLWTSYVYLENYKVREVRGSQRIATEITKQKKEKKKNYTPPQQMILTFCSLRFKRLWYKSQSLLSLCTESKMCSNFFLGEPFN